MIYYGSLQLLDLAMDFHGFPWISFGMPCIEGTGPRGHWRIPCRPKTAPEVGDGHRDGDLDAAMVMVANGRFSWRYYGYPAGEK